VKADGDSGGDIFVRDRKRSLTLRVTQRGEHPSTFGSGGYAPSMSNDGRFVMFRSGLKCKPDEYSIGLFVADLEHAWDDEDGATSPKSQ